jgi:hypothetical protein
MLSGAANVSVQDVPEVPDDPVAAMATVAATWRMAVRRSSIYTVVALDPLAPVVAQWASRLTGEPEQLEVAIGLVDDLPSPDYYLVAPRLSDPQVHWYTAHLRSLAPSRVVLCEPHPAAIAKALAGRPFGRALPPLADLAASARGYVPMPEVARQG